MYMSTYNYNFQKLQIFKQITNFAKESHLPTSYSVRPSLIKQLSTNTFNVAPVTGTGLKMNPSQVCEMIFPSIRSDLYQQVIT